MLEARKLPNGDWVDQSQVQLVAVRAYGGIRVIARAYEGVGVGSRVELSTRDSGLEPELGQIIEARLPEPVGTAFNPHY